MPHTVNPSAAGSLRILHATRAPVGGIFRHILDVANGQIARGHQVGILTDSLTGGERAADALADIAPRLALGVHRLPMPREPHPSDLTVGWQFMTCVDALNVDVLHGHGAKAGAFARLKSRTGDMIRVYTPHGGSLHYPRGTLKGTVYAAIERSLMNRTDLFLFESEFARDTYARMIGTPRHLVRCVFNGVGEDEFAPLPRLPDQTDLTYVGEFRHIKGADLLVDAVAKLHAAGRRVTLSLGGDGEEMANVQALVARHGLTDFVRFLGHVRARDGFARGRLLVVPSRGDSMPYVVIEAAAAAVPMIASQIGGIPEVFGPHDDALFAPSDADAMADAIVRALDAPDATMARAHALQQRVARHFSQTAMVDGVLAAYRDALAIRARPADQSASLLQPTA